MQLNHHNFISSNILQFHQSKLRYSDTTISVVVVLEGSVDVKRFNKITSMKTGDVFFVNTHEVWTMSSNDCCTVLCVDVDTSLLPNISYPFSNCIQLVDSLVGPDQSHEVSLVYRDCIFLKDILETYTIFNHDVAVSEKELMEEKIGLTLVTEYNIQNEANAYAKSVSEEKFVRYYRVIDYIFTHLNEKISLQQIAESENMQKSYFAQLWKQNDNKTFLECVNCYRLKQAERRLLFTSETNSEICKACGFSDAKYFYRNFQNEFNMTPIQWKTKWMTNFNTDEKVLPYEEGLYYISNQQAQLDYVKTDTRLYQQYLWLRNAVKENDAIFELTIDLFHPDNVLVLDQQRLLTWYGFDLLMNLVRQHQIAVTLQIGMKYLKQELELYEFKEVIAQVYSRLGMLVTKNWKFDLKFQNSEELKAATILKQWLETNLSACKVICTLN